MFLKYIFKYKDIIDSSEQPFMISSAKAGNDIQNEYASTIGE